MPALGERGSATRARCLLCGGGRAGVTGTLLAEPISAGKSGAGAGPGPGQEEGMPVGNNSGLSSHRDQGHASDPRPARARSGGDLCGATGRAAGDARQAGLHRLFIYLKHLPGSNFGVYQSGVQLPELRVSNLPPRPLL